MTREAFGLTLRRVRLQRGISIEHIAHTTNIAHDLLEALEQNDFSDWPSGIFARAYVRQYAQAIGADPDATVDEFCRNFPQGDRRAESTMREHAALVGHDLDWQDDVEQGRRATDGGVLADSEVVHGVETPSLLSRLRRLMVAPR
ncbi:MAG: helix-turn-helix domain-containing protein [Acidimicrobiia bacterium]|nr:helix-turn-helix domain-containing protein [Acidimicrobiia bacterium]